jgi:adenylosuccinate synthase
MFNWYKYSQMSALNSLRLLGLDTNFTIDELEDAAEVKLNKWKSLVGKIPQAQEMIKRIQDAYEELNNWVLDRSNKDRMDFYL